MSRGEEYVCAGGGGGAQYLDFCPQEQLSQHVLVNADELSSAVS